MNARLPVYAGPTASPCADAERWSNEQEVADERQAPLIVLAALNSIIRPGDWFKDRIYTGRGWAPDEILHEAVASDDATMDAYAELMTSPAAQKLAQCMTAWFGKQHAQAIYSEHLKEAQ